METTTVDDLVKGQALLTTIKGTSNPNKVMLELAEVVRQPNAAEIFNEGDENFNGGRARFAWRAAEAEAVKAMFPHLVKQIDAALAGKDQTVNYLNPVHPKYGSLRLQIVERSVEEVNDAFENAVSRSAKKDLAYQLENLTKTAKRAGKNGKYITSKGDCIISRTYINFGEQEHVFLPMDPSTKWITSVEDRNVALDLVATPEEAVAATA